MLCECLQISRKKAVFGRGGQVLAALPSQHVRGHVPGRVVF